MTFMPNEAGDIVLFEDRVADQLAPITYGRLAYEIQCGSYRLIDLISELECSIWSVCRFYLREKQNRDHPSILQHCEGQNPKRIQLFLNSAVVPSVKNQATIQDLLSRPNQIPQVIWDRGEVAAVLNPSFDNVDTQTILNGDTERLGILAQQLPSSTMELNLFAQPHEVVDQNMRIIDGNLEKRVHSQAYQQINAGVFVGADTTMGQHLVFDTSAGPIIIESGASIGPYTLLQGPIYLGKNCRVLEHAAIKDKVSVGHTTKIGGEVEAAIIEPFTNKQHHGFLGHSYLGSWINLGAGTCNSDLKNTYGTVNMEYNGNKVATGMQFLGCIMGDYSKSAINTGIFTGKVIGVCSMMYGFVTSNVPSFVNYARLFGQLATLPPDIMVATQERMFARRKVTQEQLDIRLMHDMYRITQHERDRLGDVIVH